MNLAKYFGGYGAPFDKKDFEGTSVMTVKVLPELIGKPLNHIAMGFISALNPLFLRVTTGELSTDSKPGRITVLIGDQMIIKDVSMERVVWLPPGIPTGNQLKRAL